MTQDDFRLMLEMMADGWTNREYKIVAECFAQNLFYSDSLNYAYTNKEELLKFFEDDDGMPQKCVFHRSVFDERGQIGAAEYTYSYESISRNSVAQARRGPDRRLAGVSA